MRRYAYLVYAVGLLGSASCLQRAVPKDISIESTFPKTPAAPTLPRKLQVVQFNVHGDSAGAVIDGIRHDKALRDADLIVLEEIHRDESIPERCSAACGLGKDLGFYSLYAPGHQVGNDSNGVAIVSRSPMLAAEVIELPYFNVHINSARRVALAATVTVDGAPVSVYAVHLDNRLNVRDRRTQMLPVLRHAQKQTNPVIIAGDFNTSPFTWIAHVVPVPTTTQDNRFEELVRAHGFATPVAESGATHRFIGMKLDGIYTRGFATIAFATAHARDVSDHLALWAYIEPTTTPTNLAAR